MKRTSLVLLSGLLLASCTQATPTPSTQRWDTLMGNPLYAARYWADLTDLMANTMINEKNIKKDPRLFALVDETRRYALEQSHDVGMKNGAGRQGTFVSVTNETHGAVLLLNSTLSFSPDFQTLPGIALTIFLSEQLNPDPKTFPDATAKSIAHLESPYGAQSYDLPPSLALQKFRSVALYDTRLKKLYGYAQIQ